MEAAKQTLHLPGSHILPRCIRGLEGAFFAGHTKSYLLACISLLCLSPRLRDRIKGVCVCASPNSLYLHCTVSANKMRLSFYALAHTTGVCLHVCCVCVLLDGVRVCVCAASAVMKRNPPRPPSLHTQDKHSSGNKSGQRLSCTLLMVGLEMSFSLSSPSN